MYYTVIYTPPVLIIVHPKRKQDQKNVRKKTLAFNVKPHTGYIWSACKYATKLSHLVQYTRSHIHTQIYMSGEGYSVDLSPLPYFAVPKRKFIERKNDISNKFACSDGATICLCVFPEKYFQDKNIIKKKYPSYIQKYKKKVKHWINWDGASKAPRARWNHQREDFRQEEKRQIDRCSRNQPHPPSQCIIAPERTHSPLIIYRRSDDVYMLNKKKKLRRILRCQRGAACLVDSA